MNPCWYAHGDSRDAAKPVVLHLYEYGQAGVFNVPVCGTSGFFRIGPARKNSAVYKCRRCETYLLRRS